MKRLALTALAPTLSFVLFGCGGTGGTTTNKTDAKDSGSLDGRRDGATPLLEVGPPVEVRPEMPDGMPDMPPPQVDMRDAAPPDMAPPLPDMAPDVTADRTPDVIMMMPDVARDLTPDLMPDMTIVPPVPTCAVTKPTKIKLNGVMAPQGDRTSVAGADYQTAFVVSTSAEDGQQIRLEIAPAATPMMITTVMAPATGGTAAFAGVTLKPDGDFVIQAVCRNLAGGEGRSAATTYSVDSTPPDLTVTDPIDGKRYLPGDLVGGKFKVCSGTTSADAVNVAPVGMSTGNYCATIGTASPVCGMLMAAAGGGNGCVSLDCPGGAPFSVTVSLSDASGNASQKTVQAVTCSSMLPTVQIVTPTGDMTPFTDQSKRLLAASAAQTFKDLDMNTAGAQTNVVACTDRTGSTARLFAGLVGSPLTMVGADVTVVAAQVSDNCPAGLGFVAKFMNVTLPESTLDAAGNLTTATQIRVDDIDTVLGTGSSPVLNLWVDSVAPAISITSPTPFCFTAILGSPNALANVVTSSNPPQSVVTVTNGAQVTSYNTPTIAGTTATFANVLLRTGANVVTAAVTDPAGNTGALASACSVTVFSGPPVVTWVTPAPAINQLCATGNVSPTCVADSDASAGWQGVLTAQVTLDGSPVNMLGTVTFRAGATVLGTAAIMANGQATLTAANMVTNTTGIPEGVGITVTATTSDIMSRGMGTVSRMFTVDVQPPPSGGSVTILPFTNDMNGERARRATTFSLQWPRPVDLGTSVASYEVRGLKMAAAAVDCAAFDFLSAQIIVGPTVATAGATEGVDFVNSTVYIENNYCFGVRSKDTVGNLGTVMTTAAPGIAHFRKSVLNPTLGGNERFGFLSDGSGSVDGGSVSDVVVGTLSGLRVYIYLGGAANFAPTASDFTAAGTAKTVPDVVIQGTSAFFGSAVAQIGDFDGDGFGDIAIGARSANKVFIYKGRAVWPATLTEANADWEIAVDTGMDAGYVGSSFGARLARLGNFDGDMAGTDDFAISARFYPDTTSRRGRVVIIKGAVDVRVPGSSKITLTMPTDASRSIVIDGPSTDVDNTTALVTPIFGDGIVGLGNFYSDGQGTTAVISAPGFASGSTAGTVYAYRMVGGVATLGHRERLAPNGTNGAAFATMVANLGTPTGGMARVGIGNNADSITAGGVIGSVFAATGTAGTGPFTPRATLNNPGIDNTGQLVFGAGLPGLNTLFSIIGGPEGDIGVVAVVNGGPNIFITSGSQTLSTSGVLNLSTVAEVRVPLPTGWAGTALASGGLVRDINGDGVADFAVADAPAAVPGRVAVFW